MIARHPRYRGRTNSLANRVSSEKNCHPPTRYQRLPAIPVQPPQRSPHKKNVILGPSRTLTSRQQDKRQTPPEKQQTYPSKGNKPQGKAVPVPALDPISTGVAWRTPALIQRNVFQNATSTSSVETFPTYSQLCLKAACSSSGSRKIHTDSYFVAPTTTY